MLPFGLTEEAKQEMAQLRRPQPDAKIELGNSSFSDYQTRAGDTLQTISTRFYGRPDFYLDIYLANRDQLRNPGSVPAGVTLRIPVYDQ